MADIIQVDIDLSALNNDLQRLARRMENLSPVMRSIAEIMLDDVEENFAQQRSSDGVKWKPLKESTIEKRERQGYWPGKILQMRGELAASVQSDAGRNFALVSTNRRYAAIHQFGGKAGRGKKAEIPPRPFLGLSDRALSDIENDIKDWLINT